jgi:hypothetical protein
MKVEGGIMTSRVALFPDGKFATWNLLFDIFISAIATLPDL